MQRLPVCVINFWINEISWILEFYFEKQVSIFKDFDKFMIIIKEIIYKNS